MAPGTATAETTVLGRGVVTRPAPAATAEASADDGGEDPRAARERRPPQAARLLDLRARAAAHRSRGGHRLVLRGRPRSARHRARDRDLLPDNARQVLRDEGFEVVDAERNDPVVPPGQVSGTDPAAGEQARRGSEITMFVSLGPQHAARAPTSIGQPEPTRARPSPTSRSPSRALQQFSADVAAGSVIAVLGADGTPLGAEYAELGAVTLVVSVGAVPDRHRHAASPTPRRPSPASDSRSTGRAPSSATTCRSTT
jgi:serine/threonine-protein kinase